MLAELQKISREAADDNPFLGLGMAKRLRSDSAAITPDLSLPQQWLIHIELAKHELRLGNERVALEHYSEANRLLEASHDPVPLDKFVRTMLETGVAHMRHAESRNCVAHHTSESCIFPIQGGGVHVEPESARQAVRYFTRALEKLPPDSWSSLKARWLLNVAHMTLGSYPDGVPQPYRIAPETFASDETFPRFVDIAPALGLNSFDLAGAAIGEDFRGVGLVDILVSTSDTSGPLHFFRNNGDGTFTDRTRQAGLEGLLGGLNMVHADYDNDGDPDVLVLRGGWWRQWGRHPNSLLRNNGNGTFTDVTFEAGLGEVHYPTQTAAWADYDNDGDLDLYVGNETDIDVSRIVDYTGTDLPFNVRAPCQLFRNEGDGTFTDVASEAGVENLGYAKAVVWGDYDGDRWPDLYVSNMGGRNRLYRNNGDGRFTDVAKDLGVERPYASFPAWFWDANNDGVLDLFVAAYGGPRLPADVTSVAAGYLGLRNPGGELARLYLGDGAGGFDEVGLAWGLTRPTLPMGSNFGDLDNDGYLDFYLGTGYPQYEGLMPNVMYRNRAGQGFADVTTAGGFGHLQKGHGVVFADLDDDGDQDVFEQVGGAYPGDGFGNVLFENPGFDHRWIKIKLRGTRSNRSAIGARVRVDILEDGQRRSIFRHVNGGGSFGSNPLRREIGLGRAERIESLEVYWPASDVTQRFENVPLDRMIEIEEGRDGFHEVPLEHFSFAVGS